MKVLVVGATGKLGGEISDKLIAKGHTVRAMVRPTSKPDRVERLRALGAELATAELTDRASLKEACRGVEGVVSTAIWRTPSAEDLAGHLYVIEAAKDARVRRFVFVSFTAPVDVECPYRDAKRKVEGRLIESGVEYAILRPTHFMEAWVGPDEGFEGPRPVWTIYGTGENKVPWISRHDVAEFAVQALENPSARNRVIDLGGPEHLSPLETVRIFEARIGKKFDVRYISEADLLRQHLMASTPAEKTSAALRLNFARGERIPMTDVLRDFPIELRSVEEYAREITATSQKK